MKNNVLITVIIISLLSLVIWWVYVSMPKEVDSQRDNDMGSDSVENDVEKKVIDIPSVYDFTLKDLSGGTYTLSNLRKSKPIVIAFYATWCPTCQVSAPKLTQMYENYKKDVEVIAIASKEKDDLVLDFIKKHGITHPVLLDPEGNVALNYGVGYNDFFVLINRDGSVYKKLTGGVKESELVRFIDNN